MPQFQVVSGENGSALVVALAFSIVMAIVGSGLMLLSGDSVRHEGAAFENDKTFLAAESGLLIGNRWLKDTVNWNNYNQYGKSLIYAGVINGVNDTVRLVLLPDSQLELQSDATGNELGFIKRISWGVKRIVSPNPGVFINNLDNGQKTVGQGGLNNVWIDGPFHSNTPIYLSAVSNSKADGASVYFVNGDVSVYYHNESEWFENGDKGGYGVGQSGDYNHGIYVKSGQSMGDTNVAKKLDYTFQKHYGYGDSLWMDTVSRTDIVLPVNTSSTNRAILHYDTVSGVGKATYVYYAGGTKKDTTYTVNNRVFRARNAVSVLGIVKGQTTLVTDSGCNIYPVGDLTYADFMPDANSYYDNYNNANNYGVGTVAGGNTNVLALVSGADIHFEDGNKQQYNASTKSLSDAANNATMYLTASLIAIRKGHGLMWDTKNMTGVSKDMMQNNFNYTLRAIGSRTIDNFFNYMGGGGTNANSKIRFFVDTRLLNNFSAPGVPGFKSKGTGGEGLFTLKTDWREQNIPVPLP